MSSENCDNKIVSINIHLLKICRQDSLENYYSRQYSCKYITKYNHILYGLEIPHMKLNSALIIEIIMGVGLAHEV